MTDKIMLYVIRSSRGAFIKRVAVINDRDKRLYPFVIAYETKFIAEAIRFDNEIAAQALADFLSETRDDSYTYQPIL